jgi:hypothetical protein
MEGGGKNRFEELKNPKVFISYSWTSKTHENWVLALAKDLELNGVHAVIDKWDLPEGGDSSVFMEQMVTDPSIDKILMVCDRVYSEKADRRAGGVGTEAQIISRELYDQEDRIGRSQRFIPVVAEKNDKEVPYLPVFVKSRIYIDLSIDSVRAIGFEQLLRCLFDKPKHVRPERGKPPEFLLRDDRIDVPEDGLPPSEYDLGTFLQTAYGIPNRRFLSAIRDAQSVEEFLDNVFAGIRFERYRGPIFDLAKVANDVNEIRGLFALPDLKSDVSRPYSIRKVAGEVKMSQSQTE